MPSASRFVLNSEPSAGCDGRRLCWSRRRGAECGAVFEQMLRRAGSRVARLNDNDVGHLDAVCMRSMQFA